MFMNKNATFRKKKKLRYNFIFYVQVQKYVNVQIHYLLDSSK